MTVWLHLKYHKDLLCHHLCLQRTSLEDQLKYQMSAESEKSTIIWSKVMTIAHLKAFRTLKIGLNRNRDSGNPNDSEDDCAADVGSYIEQDNIIDDPECPELRDVRPTPNVP